MIYIFVCFTLDYIAIALDISITMTLINEFAWLREAVSLFTFIQIARWRSPKNGNIDPQVGEVDSKV